MREMQAEAIRNDALTMYQAGVAIMGGKKGNSAFQKWLKNLG